MIINQAQLITELKCITEHHLRVGKEEFKPSLDEKLRWKPSRKKWNCIECLEHLNAYGRYYLPELNQAIKNDSTTKSVNYNSGFLGDIFAFLMKQNQQGKVKLKMKAFRDYDPTIQNLDSQIVITEFIQQQEKLISLLERAKNQDIEKAKIPISISRFIKLNLGDTLRFVVYHNERHMNQALKVWGGYME